MPTNKIKTGCSRNYIAQNYRKRFEIDPRHDFGLEYKKCSPGGDSDDDFYIFVETDQSGEILAKYEVNSSYKYSNHCMEHYFHKFSADGVLLNSGQLD